MGTDARGISPFLSTIFPIEKLICLMYNECSERTFDNYFKKGNKDIMHDFPVASLNPHKKNDYFFDDMTGSKWEEFIESVRTSGVIEPIVITRDYTIVSGHQRVRACKELGIEKIPARIKDYANEDEILKDLLETNVRQRGNIDGSALKLGRIIAELERIYGVQHGNNQRTSPMANSRTQDELFEMLGVSKDTYHRAKNLLELIPELQDSLEEGYISASAASRLLARLPESEQIEVFASMPKDVKLSQKEVKEYIDKVREEDAEDFEDIIARIKEANAELTKAKEEARDARIETARIRKEMEDADRDVVGDVLTKLNIAEIELRGEYEKHEKTKLKLRDVASENFELKAQKNKAEALLDSARKRLEELRSVEESGLSIENQRKMEELFKQISLLEKKCMELEHENETLVDAQHEYKSDIEELIRYTENACNVIDAYSRSEETLNLVSANPEIKHKVETRVKTLINRSKRIINHLNNANCAAI